jgi:thioester reductase-like protein
MSLVYLKPNAIAEPLFNQWYAWSYLIPPASAALYLANSHLPILESFIEAPQVHQTAIQDSAMRGGPFIHYDASRVPEIQALLEQTRQQQADLLALAQALQSLDRWLPQSATGESLEPLYAQIPDLLKGYVELVYDPHHHPSFRLWEGLLYKSPFYHPQSQSIALSLGTSDRRSFVLSTPRLPDPNQVQLPIPFADRRWDHLFAMRYTPRPYGEIKELLEAPDGVFSSLFTETPPPIAPRYTGHIPRVRYYGHACVLIEMAEVSILCDPLLGYQHSSGIPRYTYADLPAVIDYVLITHNHQDHVMFETLLQLRHKIKTVIVPKSNKGSLIDPSLKLILQAIGFTQVVEIDELETLPIPQGSITSLPVLGEHGDLNIAAKTAYWISVQGKSILCAADSNNIEPELYRHLAHHCGNLDSLFIGMECQGAPYTWAYGALLTHPIAPKAAQSRRLDGSNADRALQLIQHLNPQQVYVYAMGQEPWLTHITSIEYQPDSRPIVESNQLITQCHDQGIHAERLLGSREILLDGATPAAQPIQTWLATLAAQDIKFNLDTSTPEPRLKCNAPKGLLTSDLQAQLKQRKSEIIQFLTPSSQRPDLEAEAILDPSIVPLNSPLNPIAFQSSQNILLTGATGFLGAFLLSELLQQTAASIHCLVRSDTLITARQKLYDRLHHYGIWQDSFADRILPVLGDLTLPHLGLSTADWRSLTHQLDTIYHNAAWVHHTSPYSRLKAANVLGTQEILRFACQGKTKPLHFISTISVFAASHTTGVQVVTEDTPLSADRLPSSGYAQSKWVAEKLVTIAQSRGLPVIIYRPGAISGDSRTGVFNENDFLYRLIQGCIQLGAVPQGEMPLNLLPVDYVSRAIVAISRQSTALGKAFHLIHPQPGSSDRLFDLLRSSGYPIQAVPYDQWRTYLLNIAQHSPDHPLYPIMPLFSTSHAQSQTDVLPILEFDTTHTTHHLQSYDIAYPPIDTALLKTYLSYLIHHQLIQSPAQIA